MITNQTKDFDTLQRFQKSQIDFFNNGSTRDIAFRKKSLINLKKTLTQNEEAICKALYDDFRKSAFESEITEFVIVMIELKRTLKNLDKWTRPKSVPSSLINFPSTSKIIYEPYGNVLIIAPWNYPFQLVMAPVIAAIAAGNTITIKPSELTPHTSDIISKICEEVFDPGHIHVIKGDKETSQNLLKLKWDYIFFTGSPRVGTLVYQAAAKKLTPVTLELGGKNPCIVDATAPLALTARRIIWGKCVNAGQTCIAPDYLLVHEDIKTALIAALNDELHRAYGADPKESADLPRIINAENFNRISDYLSGQDVIIGGETDATQNYIAPTVLDMGKLNTDLSLKDLPQVLQEEVFGPILPILTYTQEAQLKPWIEKYEKPLALYVFSKDKHFTSRIVKSISYGGGVVNDTMAQFVNSRLPFGGVGKSGIGAYHGFKSFETFSHKKAMVYKATWLDIKMRYAPYTLKFKWVQKMSKFF